MQPTFETQFQNYVKIPELPGSSGNLFTIDYSNISFSLACSP